MILQHNDILYADFDNNREDTFSELKAFITTNTTANMTLIALNLSEGELFIGEHDEFISDINEWAGYFKECHFYNSNAYLPSIFEYEKYPNVKKAISYPYGLLNRTKFYKFEEKRNISYSEKKFEKHFIFMNAVAKNHRIRMYVDFHKHDIMHTAHVSWLNRYEILNSETVAYHRRINGIDLAKKRILDRSDLKGTHQDDLSSYYEVSAIDIFGESVVENPHCVFPTEKTWKPILYKKVFFGFSTKGFYRWLQNEGFILYDELIDYSFDGVEDYNARYELFWNEIYKLSQIPLNELSDKIDSIRWKLDHNYNVAMSKNSIPEMLEPYSEYTNLLWTMRS
jgi:hypothetical protein